MDKKKTTHKKFPRIAFPKLTWRLKTILIVIILVIIGFIVKSLSSGSEKGYIFETVERQNLTEIVSESGNVSTAGITNVFSPTSGIIEEIYVSNGEIVGQDQELFKVVSTATEDDKVSAYANLIAAQSSLKTAQQTKLTLQASLETARKGVLDSQTNLNTMMDNRANSYDNPSTGEKYTQLEIDSIESAYQTSKLSFDAAEKKYVEADIAIAAASAAVAKTQLAYDSTEDRVIKSPTIGTVSNMSIAPGTSVNASTNGSLVGETATPVLTIANFSSNEIVLALNESDISKVAVGQRATVDPDAIDSQYNAVVKRIDSIGHDDDGVIVYNVYLDILDPDEKLKSGMTVDVDIVTEEITNVLAVSTSAVKPYQGGRAVRIYNKQTKELEYIPVEVGVRGKKYTQILSGLEEGQRIVVALSNEQINRSGPFGF